MTTYPLAHIFTGSFGLQTTDPAQWLVLFISLGLLTGQLLYFARAGRQEAALNLAGRREIGLQASLGFARFLV